MPNTDINLISEYVKFIDGYDEQKALKHRIDLFIDVHGYEPPREKIEQWMNELRRD